MPSASRTPPVSSQEASRCWAALISSTSERRRRLYCDCEGSCGNQPGAPARPSRGTAIGTDPDRRLADGEGDELGVRGRGRSTAARRDRVLVGEDLRCSEEGFQIGHLELPSRGGHISGSPSRALEAGPCRNPSFHIKPLVVTMAVRRGAGAVERGGLENRWACKRPVGSNPTPAVDSGFSNTSWSEPDRPGARSAVTNSTRSSRAIRSREVEQRARKRTHKLPTRNPNREQDVSRKHQANNPNGVAYAIAIERQRRRKSRRHRRRDGCGNVERRSGVSDGCRTPPTVVSARRDSTLLRAPACRAQRLRPWPTPSWPRSRSPRIGKRRQLSTGIVTITRAAGGAITDERDRSATTRRAVPVISSASSKTMSAV